MNTYDFQTQLTKGEKAERKLDAHFAAWFNLRPASRDDQRSGIDRWYTDRHNLSIPVEYKTDWRAAQTGNAFIETVSVDTAHKQGWAYTSRATVLLYYCPGSGGEQVYWLRMHDIRSAVGMWEKQYPTKRIPNRDYYTEGVIVPLRELERLAVQVISI